LVIKRQYYKQYFMQEEQTILPEQALPGLEISNPNPANQQDNKKESSGHEEPKAKKREQDALMASSLGATSNPPSVDDIVEGDVLATDKSALYVDLSPYGTGIIYGREFRNAREVIRKINVGDKVAAKVIDTDNPNGYIELSLKEARQALMWSEAERAMLEKRVLEITPKEANKGGLIIDWQGVSGFLPASQLSSEHYPKVEGGDKDKILDELRKFTGEKMAVTIISVKPKEGKLIFSEKSMEFREKENLVGKYAMGDELDGEVTGIVDFGVFVKVEDNLEGLVHLSEIDWGLVENPHDFVSVGQKIKVKVIEIKDGKISLSIKALKHNQWIDAAKKYKKGAEIDGVVMRYNRHGALASIEEGIAGLVHVSEFSGSIDELKKKLELGKSYPFTITLFDPEHQRMALSYKRKVPES
jgi:small subunit ribosomal protein S1